MISVATKMVGIQKIFPSLLLACCCWIRDPRSGMFKNQIRDPGLTSRIRNADCVVTNLEEPLVSEDKVERGPAHSEGETPLLQLNNQNNRNQTNIFPVIGI